MLGEEFQIYLIKLKLHYVNKLDFDFNFQMLIIY